MRDSYDGIVLGSDPAACLIASQLAERGFRIALANVDTYASQQPSDDAHWLLPQHGSAIEPLQRLGLTHSFRQSLTRREHLLERTFGSQPSVHAPLPMQLVSIAEVRQHSLDFVAARGVEVIHTCHVLRSPTLHPREAGRGVRLLSTQHRERDLLATTIIDCRPGVETSRDPAHDKLTSPVIWGLYRNVCRLPGPQGGTAFWYSSDTGAEMWIVPIDDELTSVGGSFHNLTYQTANRPDFWEEQLVACPAIVERLFDAELVGAMRIVHSSEIDLPAGTENEPLGQIVYPPFHRYSPIDLPWHSLASAAEFADKVLAGFQSIPIA